VSVEKENVAADRQIEEGTDFRPRFDENGLITAIAQDSETGQVLMVAYMNKDALDETLRTRCGVYYSRSRKRLWRKGEQSGHTQEVQQVLTDCDQDCIILKVKVDSGQCHVGYQSCFYRAVSKVEPTKLEFVAQKVYDPEKTYG
jgi:phosphoribosyl-AMP cyclohydrolase